MTVKTLNESDFMKHLELAIQFGKSFLFENVGEELDPMLDPILEKAVTIEGGAKTIQVLIKSAPARPPARPSSLLMPG